MKEFLSDRKENRTLEQELRLAVLVPLRDDWASATELIPRIDETISTRTSMEIFLVDDGSIQPYDRSQFQGPFSRVRAIHVLRLRRNLGHQRAIAIGLAYIHAHVRCDAVLVMDGDGEDTPEGVTKLLEAFSQTGAHKIIFAGRARRSESLVFRCFYHLYRGAHWILTGIKVRVGNFSLLPAASLSTLAATSELWNHYAAAIFRSKLPFDVVPIARGKRIAGVSTMNFSSLVTHGLSAISVFADVVGVRLVIGTVAGSVLCGLAVALVVFIRFFTALAVPGWATYATIGLIVIMLQLLTIAVSFTFFMLSNRTNLGFVPSRDYNLFLESDTEIFHE